MTPGEYKARGKDLEIAYGYHATPFGECLLAKTGRGICGLNFVQNNDRRPVFESLEDRWQNATLIEDPDVTRPFVERIFNPSQGQKSTPLHLVLSGTNFQIKVWEALIKIPMGAVVSYENVAAHIGMPKASRAVGNAVGSNPISFVIPCHRVIKKTAEFGNYGGGVARKLAILGWEAVRSNNSMVIFPLSGVLHAFKLLRYSKYAVLMPKLYILPDGCVANRLKMRTYYRVRSAFEPNRALPSKKICNFTK